MGPFSEQKCRYDEEDGQTGSITGVIPAQQLEDCRLGTSKLLGGEIDMDKVQNTESEGRKWEKG